MGRRYRSPGPDPRIVRVTEIAELLGVTHQRTSVIVRQPGFPAPVGRQGRSRLWDRPEVVSWARIWRREKPQAVADR
jgi:predicted DNA-binding transcriptional regulator AlpA